MPVGVRNCVCEFSLVSPIMPNTDETSTWTRQLFFFETQADVRNASAVSKIARIAGPYEYCG